MLVGTVGRDVAANTFFARSLFKQAPALEALRFRDERERQAHRLLEVADQVKVTKLHDLGAEGRKIEGEVNDKKAKRSYRPSFTLDREARTTGATCSCATFQRSGTKEGPCEHMMALRLAFVRAQAELEKARNTEEGRKLIRAETRTLVRRKGEKTLTYRVSLDDRKLVVRFGPFGTERMQQLYFDRSDAARSAYFARLEELLAKGFIDASAAD
ncbi:MAG: SWIM zinc finger family protein [Myxococcales bacterium]